MGRYWGAPGTAGKDAKYVWTASHQVVFNFADKVMERVKTLVLGRATALVTNWFKEKVRFVLQQKVCKCVTVSPHC